MAKKDLSPIGPGELRAALVAAGMALGSLLADSRGTPGWERAMAGLRTVRAALARPDEVPPSQPARVSADELVAGWDESGGDWHALVAAVNRSALGATTRRHGTTEKETSHVDG